MMSAAKTSVGPLSREQHVLLLTPMQLYNMHAADFRSCLVIVDVRDATAFSACTIDAAHHFDMAQATSCCSKLLGSKSQSSSQRAQALVEAATEGRKIHWTVVICGNAVSESDTKKLTAVAVKVQNEELRHAMLQSQARQLPHWAHKILPDEHAAVAADVFCQLESVSQVAYLCGGVAAFRNAYPFMCTDANNFEPDRLYPSQIIGTLPKPERPLRTARFVIEEEVNFGGPLYLSSHSLASDPVILSCLGITHVVNVTPEYPNVDQLAGRGATRRFLRIPIVDRCDQDIRQYFESACEFIDKALAQEGAAVLVHCGHGQSRSATIVAAWLMRRDAALTSERAIEYLRECRQRVRPNEAFREQLAAEEVGRANKHVE